MPMKLKGRKNNYMATLKQKNEALGGLLLATLDLSKKRGGNQKIQKILGKENYWQVGKRWLENTPVIKTYSIAKLKSLTKKVKEHL